MTADQTIQNLREAANQEPDEYIPFERYAVDSGLRRNPTERAFIAAGMIIGTGIFLLLLVMVLIVSL